VCTSTLIPQTKSFIQCSSIINHSSFNFPSSLEIRNNTQALKEKNHQKDKTMATCNVKKEKVEIEFIIILQFQKIKHLNSKPISNPKFQIMNNNEENKFFF